MADPRIICFDIETLPNLSEALKVWPSLSDFPGRTLKASITSVICVGWKVLGAEQTNCINAWDFPSWLTDVNDDRAVCEATYEVLKGVDCVVTHNGKRFDWKFIQTRLLYYGLPPLPNIHHVDTCAEAKRNLMIFNNRLNVIARFLTEKEKLEHEGWDLWVKVHARDPVAMAKMTEYCMQDVVVLEDVFRSLRPIIKSLPNYNLFSPARDNVCPNCGSTRLQSNGRRYTKTKAYRRYICMDCQTWSNTDIKDELPR